MLPPVFGGSKTSEGKVPHPWRTCELQHKKKNASVQTCLLSTAVPETVLYRGWAGKQTRELMKRTAVEVRVPSQTHRDKESEGSSTAHTTISGRVCKVDFSWSAGERVSGRYMARDSMSNDVGLS